jgi:hypothetical protein
MKIQINKSPDREVVSKVTIIIDENVEFRISLNSFNEVVINKMDFSNGESLTIKPSVGNEIKVS